MSAIPVHIWETVEITLEAEGAYDNPYTDVVVWVDLEGPGFEKRIYGFWDGGSTFRVRMVASAPGDWRWRSGASVADPGLCGQRGRFTASEWLQGEKLANACRRGFLRVSADGHAFSCCTARKDPRSRRCGARCRSAAIGHSGLTRAAASGSMRAVSRQTHGAGSLCRRYLPALIWR